LALIINFWLNKPFPVRIGEWRYLFVVETQYASKIIPPLILSNFEHKMQYGGGSFLSLLLQHSGSEQWLSIDYLAGTCVYHCIILSRAAINAAN
jgi:hypothetical protein